MTTIGFTGRRGRPGKRSVGEVGDEHSGTANFPPLVHLPSVQSVSQSTSLHGGGVAVTTIRGGMTSRTSAPQVEEKTDKGYGLIIEGFEEYAKGVNLPNEEPSIGINSKRGKISLSRAVLREIGILEGTGDIDSAVRLFFNRDKMRVLIQFVAPGTPGSYKIICHRAYSVSCSGFCNSCGFETFGVSYRMSVDCYDSVKVDDVRGPVIIADVSCIIPTATMRDS